MEHIAPKFKDLTGVSLDKIDVSYDRNELIHITPYEYGAGWNFDPDDPKNFWFESIDSWTYRFVDFDEIVELMDWVAEQDFDWEAEYDKWNAVEEED